MKPILYPLKKKNYKGAICLCGKPVTTGSKSGKCKSCSAIGRPKSEQLKSTLRIKLKGNKNALGYRHSIEARRKRAERQKGSNNPFWKGGVSTQANIIRGSIEYTLWRESVFKRDNYTCIWCGDDRGGNLNADHIKPFAYYPELRFAIDNGRTLCIKCHMTTETYGNRKHNV